MYFLGKKSCGIVIKPSKAGHNPLKAWLDRGKTFQSWA